MPAFVAVDLGAESGRVIRGDIESDRLRIATAARFLTGMEPIDGHLRWNLHEIEAEVITGLGAAGAEGPANHGRRRRSPRPG